MIYNKHEASDEKETGRLEAFSDGVFAIAITLLVLGIAIPQIGNGKDSLQEQVIKQWPSFLAYVISFMNILIMWSIHHALFKLIHRTNHLFMILNGLLLMLITFVNYPTAVLASYIQSSNPDEQKFAALLYSGAFILIAIFYNVLWRYAAFNHRLLSKKVSSAQVERITKEYRFGPLFYLIAFALGFLSVWASVAVNAALVIYFAFTGQEKRDERRQEYEQAESDHP